MVTPSKDVPLFTCTNPKRHASKIHTIQIHHVVPKSWGGDDTHPNTMGTPSKPSNTTALCGTCHDNAHALYNLWIHAAGKPASSVLVTFDKFIRDLAERAWANSTHRVYTVSQPEGQF